MHKPLVILDPGHGGLSSFFYDLDNGVKLSHTWEEVTALDPGEKRYFSRLRGERWERGELAFEPRFYFERKGRRITWGDPGSLSPIDPRICEKDLVLDVARSLHRILGEEMVVKLTRDRDGYVAAASRARFANRAAERHDGDAVLISLHAEAHSDPETCGFRVWHPPGRSGSLARTVAAALERHLEERRATGTCREIREEPWPLLDHVEVPGVRVDLGFLSHPSDARRLLERQVRHELAGSLAQALQGYLACETTAPRKHVPGPIRGKSPFRQRAFGSLSEASP